MNVDTEIVEFFYVDTDSCNCSKNLQSTKSINDRKQKFYHFFDNSSTELKSKTKVCSSSQMQKFQQIISILLRTVKQKYLHRKTVERGI